MQTSASERKPLLRISNLKQYFPLKKKGLYVKANDGITLDIFEGETLGLVGESGCGKSTLGRTILQLYRQTDGRTMYYGRTLDELAPRYVGETIKTLAKRRAKLKTLEAKRDALQAEYEAMEDGAAKYAKKNDLDQAAKEANDCFLDMANLVGGFMMVDDLKPVTDAFLAVYNLSSKLHAADVRLQDAELDLEDANFAVTHSKNAEKAKAQAARFQEKVNGIKAEMDEIRKEIAEKHAAIEEMRKP